MLAKSLVRNTQVAKRGRLTTPVADLAGDIERLHVVVNRPEVLTEGVVSIAKVSKRPPLTMPVAGLASNGKPLFLTGNRLFRLTKRVVGTAKVAKVTALSTPVPYSLRPLNRSFKPSDAIPRGQT